MSKVDAEHIAYAAVQVSYILIGMLLTYFVPDRLISVLAPSTNGTIRMATSITATFIPGSHISFATGTSMGNGLTPY